MIVLRRLVILHGPDTQEADALQVLRIEDSLPAAELRLHFNFRKQNAYRDPIRTCFARGCASIPLMPKRLCHSTSAPNKFSSLLEMRFIAVQG